MLLNRIVIPSLSDFFWRNSWHVSGERPKRIFWCNGGEDAIGGFLN
jgi:hypothetical protein